MRIRKPKINPLMVIMSPRDFPIAWYWIDKIDFLDKLIIKYHLHHEAHEIAQKFFLEHKEYTHFLIVTDDIIVTPDHIKLLIRDYLEYKYPVISCYTNWEWYNDWLNITGKDMRGIKVMNPYQYRFYKLKDLLKFIQEKKVSFPLMKVFFVGLPCTLVERSVVETVGFRPYRYITDTALGILARRGIMFDLQFAIDCANNDIPIYVDLRCLLMHFGDTRRFINLWGKKKYVKFISKKRELEL
mgnify:CR=1 FL=1